MTQDEINAVKKAAEKMRKQESAQDEIIEMARKVGLVINGNQSGFDDLEAFAKLVIAKEREACAKIVEESSLPDTYSQECMPDIANDIRARGQA
ncbi:hypothetical protein UFOVP588_21 [uncultured Caudovirales phage]|uniref:FH2 domain-containing protein n=1 Tax=uncultured Caudovirales phage TaxID=2100421 RepID=A0A6J5N786_9CAUD|nr:hypothetical protein UFOVP588_21 [uncultured Caudovirales phage]